LFKDWHLRNKRKLQPPDEKARDDFAELVAQSPNKIRFVFTKSYFTLNKFANY